MRSAVDNLNESDRSILARAKIQRFMTHREGKRENPHSLTGFGTHSPEARLRKVVEKSVSFCYFQFTSTLARQQPQRLVFKKEARCFGLVRGGSFPLWLSSSHGIPMTAEASRSAQPQLPVPVGNTFAGRYRVLRPVCHQIASQTYLKSWPLRAG